MNVFHYESKPMQVLMYIGDLIILNVIYLLCCLPVFTMGAAQAGLYSAVKVLNDKEDDSSPAAAFFKGFANGFGTVTIAWGILTVALCGITVASYLTALNNAAVTGINIPVWVFAIPVILAVLFQSLVPIFHSQFSCKPLHLIRNCWFLLVGHPLRSIGVAVLIWLPVILLLVDPFTFLSIIPVWITLYFSTAATFSLKFMKKPFATLIEYFSQQAEDETQQLPGEGETAQEDLEENTVTAE